MQAAPLSWNTSLASQQHDVNTYKAGARVHGLNWDCSLILVGEDDEGNGAEVVHHHDRVVFPGHLPDCQHDNRGQIVGQLNGVQDLHRYPECIMEELSHTLEVHDQRIS